MADHRGSAPPYDICMLVQNPVTSDSRVRKEARSLAGAGWRVLVVGLNSYDRSFPEEETLDGYAVRRVYHHVPRLQTMHQRLTGRTKRITRTIRYVVARAINLRDLVARQKANYWGQSGLQIGPTGRSLRQTVLQSEAPVFHAHDFPALVEMSRAARSRRDRPTLIYDSHELFFGREAPTNRRQGMIRTLLRRWEKRLARQCRAIVTVSPGIADRMRADWGVSAPLLIRNAVDHRWPGRVHDLGLEADRTIVHTGHAHHTRNLHQLIEALALIRSDLELVMVGTIDGAYRQHLEALATEVGVVGRIRFLPPVPVDDIAPTIARAAIGISLRTRQGGSFLYTLPNKIFEYVAAGLPIVAGGGPDMSNLVSTNRIGEICDESDPASIARAIDETMAPERRVDLKRRVAEVRQNLNWSSEAAPLVRLYRTLLGSQSDPE